MAPPHMRKAGDVSHAIVDPSGSGLVTYSSLEAARWAVEHLNGSILKNKTINVHDEDNLDDARRLGPIEAEIHSIL